MILNGQIMKMDVRKTAYPKRQEYWRLVIVPIVGGKPSKVLKYVNFHEPRARHINMGDFSVSDLVSIKCYERKGSSGKMFIHGIKIINVSKKRGRTHIQR